MDSKKTSLGLNENVEAVLSYLLGWLTGIVFLFLEKESDFIRFHAMQSTVTFLGFTLRSFVLDLLIFIPFLGIFVGGFNLLIGLVAIITWIICIVKAYQ